MANRSPPSGMEQLHVDDLSSTEKLPLTYRLKIGFTKFMKSSRVFMYNKEHQTICGNTISLWIKLSLYYFFFYICAGLFFSGMVAVFAAILSRQSPRYTYRNNEMGNQIVFSVGGCFYET